AIVLEDLYRGLRQLVRNQNLGHRALLLPPGVIPPKAGIRLTGSNWGGESSAEPGSGNRQAALASVAFSAANAQSSQPVSACKSDASTVDPHQIRKPLGASRYAPMSYATPALSSRDTSALANAACPSSS